MSAGVQKLVWSEELTLYNEEIDSQHRMIFNLVNEIVEADRLHPKSDYFAQVLSRLTDYGIVHFREEEKLMQLMNYPEYLQHKQSHLDYIYKIAMFNINFKNVECSDPEEVVEYVRQWWYNHVLGDDLNFGRFIKETLVR